MRPKNQKPGRDGRAWLEDRAHYDSEMAKGRDASILLRMGTEQYGGLREVDALEIATCRSTSCSYKFEQAVADAGFDLLKVNRGIDEAKIMGKHEGRPFEVPVRGVRCTKNCGFSPTSVAPEAAVGGDFGVIGGLYLERDPENPEQFSVQLRNAVLDLVKKQQEEE